MIYQGIRIASCLILRTANTGSIHGMTISTGKERRRLCWNRTPGGNDKATAMVIGNRTCLVHNDVRFVTIEAPIRVFKLTVSL